MDTCRLLIPVLHHDGIDLIIRTYHLQILILQCHVQLLVTLVDIDIRVCRHAESDVDNRFHDIELRVKHFLIAMILIIDGEPVVAAHADPALLVGNPELIVCVVDGGV